MRGLSLQDLSDRLEKKISRQALHKYETGEVEPDNVMVQDIADALDLPDEYGGFDRVLVDAPCSNLGVLRRNPDVKWRRRPGGHPQLDRQQ